MRQLIFLIGLGLLVLAGCSQEPFDPAAADAEIPDVILDGQKEATVRADGKLYWHGRPFSGWFMEYHLDGQAAKREGYLEGKRHGLVQSWYADGQLRERRMYRNGKKEGQHEGWWKDGSLRFRRNFKNGLQHGRSRDWNAQGMLFRDFNYENGRENGPQKMWKADGRIRANYEVRNGRRFGYIGTKNCVSVSDNPAKDISDASY